MAFGYGSRSVIHKYETRLSKLRALLKLIVLNTISMFTNKSDSKSLRYWLKILLAIVTI
jgi:hypothetical protein